MTKIQNMFRTLEDLNFVIVSACDELSRVDFEFRASNFRFRQLNTYDQFWRDFYKLLLGRDTRALKPLARIREIILMHGGTLH